MAGQPHLDLTAYFDARAGAAAAPIDPDDVADQFDPITVILPRDMARVVEAAIAHRRASGPLPGAALDREAFQTVIQNYDRGRAAYAICADYLLRHTTWQCPCGYANASYRDRCSKCGRMRDA